MSGFNSCSCYKTNCAELGLQFIFLLCSSLHAKWESELLPPSYPWLEEFLSPCVCTLTHRAGAHQLICNTDDAGPSSALFKKYSHQLGSASQRLHLPSLTWILYISIKYRIIWRNTFIVHHVFLCRTMWQWDNILQFQIVSHGKEITFASQLVL